MTALLNRRRWRQPTRTDFLGALTGNNVWTGDDLTMSPVFEAIHKIVNPYNVWRVQDDKDIDIDGFNDYLQQLQTDCILKCLNGVFNKHEYLERKLMFERFGRQDYLDQVPAVPVFVGVRILPARSFGISCKIDSLALLFNGAVTFDMYLFHDSAPLVPISTTSVTAVGNTQTIINFPEFVLNYSEKNKSGFYYFGYFQSDLGNVRAIDEIVEEFNTTNYFGVVPVELPVAGGYTVNVNNISFTMKTHGFNIQISAFRDFTQQIVNSSWLFDDLIGLQMAADVIEMIQNTTRTNKDERVTAEMTAQLYKDLNLAAPSDSNPYVSGIKLQITREINRVKCEFFPKFKPTAITHDTENRNIYGVPPPLLDVFAY